MELRQEGKHWFAVRKQPGFKKWLTVRGILIKDLRGMSEAGRWKVFLRWKHGSPDDIVNEEVDRADREYIKQLRSMTKEDWARSPDKQFNKIRYRWYKETSELWQSIKTNVFFDESGQAQNVARVFGGEIT